MQIAPGLTHRIRVLLESLDELWALTWDKLDQVSSAGCLCAVHSP